MSGHSHWSSIKHQKTATDAKKSKAFSKITRQLTIAARDGGGDPGINTKLRTAIELAKRLNMPSDNIDRAIKKGTGEIEGAKLEPVTFEAYGPGGIALIIEGITDNKNRALSEIKQALSQNSGKLAGEGSVKWLFDRRGIITVSSTVTTKENFELKAIEAGAEDIQWHNGNVDIFTKIEDIENVKQNLEKQGIKIESAVPGWEEKKSIQVNKKDKKAAQKLFEGLDESDNVQEVYSNLAIRD